MSAPAENFLNGPLLAGFLAARPPTPNHPRDLVGHEGINGHPTPDAEPYRWELTENGRDFSVDVRARVLTNDPALNKRTKRR